jgi:GH25 family lysozyme M1 (1,4-beta-N-acetylmuramidase)
MKTLVDYLHSNCNSSWSGRVWLDIEGSEYWTGSYTNNKNWYQALVDSCGSLGVKCGIYASQYQWTSIFGSTTYCYGNNKPLWYAHYDSNPTFSDYSKYSFGCWTSPYAKQYAGTTTVCSVSVDLDYAPSFTY